MLLVHIIEVMISQAYKHDCLLLTIIRLEFDLISVIIVDVNKEDV